MEQRRLGLFLLCLILCLSGCGARKNEPEPVPQPVVQPAPAPVDERPVILAFGDSLTAGQDVAPAENYPSRLQVELDRKGYQYRVVNAGVSGDTTTGGLARIDRWLKQANPEIVILELGANDGLRGQSVPKMKENLAAMIERIRASGALVILAGMQMPPNYGAEYTEPFRQAFVELAAEHQVAFIPFLLDGVAADRNLNQSDGVHPTGEGYEIVVQNVLAVVEPLLKR